MVLNALAFGLYFQKLYKDRKRRGHSKQAEKLINRLEEFAGEQMRTTLYFHLFGLDNIHVFHFSND